MPTISDIRVESSPLVTCHHLTHGSVHPYYLASWQNPFEGNHVIELKKVTITDPNPELKRGCVPGPENPADHLFHSGERIRAVGQL